MKILFNIRYLFLALFALSAFIVSALSYYISYENHYSQRNTDISVAETAVTLKLVKDSQPSKVISRSGVYDYGPSLFLDSVTNQNFAYWCTPQDDLTGDQIYMATSGDNFNWKDFRNALSVTPNSEETNGAQDGHVCDPDVVKVKGQYYMYYTSAASGVAKDGVNNSIFLATSTDGSNWTKYGGNSSPKAVINNTKNSDQYGIGQSSTFYKDGKFHMYFTNTDKGGMIYKTSVDGINWENVKNEPVIRTYNVNVTYLTEYNVYIGVAARTESDNVGMEYFYSQDGITWSEPKIAPIGSLGSNHNVGILTNEEGIVDKAKLILYFGGGAGGWKPEDWDIYRIKYAVEISTSQVTIPKSTKVQGIVLNNNKSACTQATCPSDWKVSLGTVTKNASPYFFDLEPNKEFELKMTYTGDYDVYHSICNRCTQHPDSSYVKGNIAKYTSGADAFVDIYWKFVKRQQTQTETTTPTPTETSTPTPTETTAPTPTETSTPTPTETTAPTPTPSGSSTPTQTEELVVCPGLDSNGDSIVNLIDFATFAKIFNGECAPSGTYNSCGSADSNADYKIDVIDFSNFAKNFGEEKSCI